jgi:acylphosphatase
MRRRYLIEGAVQGVGFRYFAARAAGRLGLRGWVRNLPDGQVEAVGDGTAEQLSRFEATLRRGPPMASVTNLQATEVMEQEELPISFQIR